MATNTEKIVVQVIVKGGKQLDNLDGKTKKATKSVGDLNKKSNKLTKDMAKMAAGFFAAAVVFRKINQVVMNSIQTFRDFEFQMAKVRAISGSSNEDFKELTKTAQELGRTTFFTATQVAELQTNFAKLGFTTSEILKAQEATLLLATATGSDLARAAIVAGAAVRGFNLDASETTRVVDVMTLSFNSSALDIEKWQTSMTKVAPIAASMNIPLEDTAAIMGALTDAGIEASIAGTSMRNIFLQMGDSSSKLGKHLGFTVNSSVDLSRAIEKLGEASKDTLKGLVNIRQVAAFTVMIKGSARVAQLTEELRNAKGAADEAASIIGNTLEGAMKRLKSATEGLYIEMVDKLGGGMQGLADRLANFQNRLTDNSDTVIKYAKVLVRVVKWLGLAKISYIALTFVANAFKFSVSNTITRIGLFRTSLLLMKISMNKVTVATTAAKLSIIGLKAAATLGLSLVLDLVASLAIGWFQVGENTDEATTAAISHTKAKLKLKKVEEDLAEITGKALATNVKDGEKDLLIVKEKIKENTRLLKSKEWDLKLAKRQNFQIKEAKKALDLYKKSLIDLDKKRLNIVRNNTELDLFEDKKSLDDAIKNQEKKYNSDVLKSKQRYLDNIISRESYDDELESLALSGAIAMKGVLVLHKQDTDDITKKILNLKIKSHKSEFSSFKEIQDKIHNDRDKALLAETQRHLDFINDKSKTDKEQEDNAKKHSENIVKIQTDSFNAEIVQAEVYGEDKTAIEQDFVDFQLANIDKVAAAQKTADEITLESTRASSEQKMEAIKIASDAIFKIMGQNSERQLSQESKKLEEQKDSGVITEEEYEKRIEAIQRKAFERKKRMDIAQVVIDTALAVAKIELNGAVLASNPLTWLFAGGALTQLAIAIGAGIAQIAVISNQKFADGGMIEEFANGGMVHGKSHAQGGEKFAVGGRVVELEGGEAVMNKRSTAMFSNQLSAMNQAGGGVKFADGGLLNSPSFSQQQFNALGQNQMMGAMGNSGKVVVVEADITNSQNTVSVIQSQATI